MTKVWCLWAAVVSQWLHLKLLNRYVTYDRSRSVHSCCRGCCTPSDHPTPLRHATCDTCSVSGGVCVGKIDIVFLMWSFGLNLLCCCYVFLDFTVVKTNAGKSVLYQLMKNGVSIIKELPKIEYFTPFSKLLFVWLLLRWLLHCVKFIILL